MTKVAASDSVITPERKTGMFSNSGRVSSPIILQQGGQTDKLTVKEGTHRHYMIGAEGSIYSRAGILMYFFETPWIDKYFCTISS